jgi:MFS family permease
VFTLARFSEAFLLLRGSDLGLANAHVPFIMVLMNTAYAVSAYPAGWLSDRIGRRPVLAVGAAVLLAADVVLAAASGIPAVLLGALLWGIHMGLTQGLFLALIADIAPAEWRGTAFGVFSLLSGAALLAASVLAGILWDRVGAPAPFYLGAVFAAVAMAGLLWRSNSNAPREGR